MKNRRDNNTLLLTVIVVFFTIGIITGAITLFHIPGDLLENVKLSFDAGGSETETFWHLVKSNFLTEIVWVIAVWLLSNSTFLAPISVAAVSLRGFLIGYSVSFIFSSGEGVIKLILGNILPQVVISMPLLTFFTIMSVSLSAQRNQNPSEETRRLLLGVIFAFLTLIVAMLEAGWSIFINM